MKIGSKISGGTKLRQAIEENGIVVMPGTADAFGAQLIEMAGFKGLFVGSYALHCSLLASQDKNILTQVEIVDQIRRITHAVDIPVFVDGESGGETIEATIREIQLFEEAGVAAIHIDDERKPCKCPYLNTGKKQELVSIDEMCQRIRIATETRKDKDMLIIARCDTLGSVYDDGTDESIMEEQIKRLKAYAAAGADVIFPTMRTWDAYRRVLDSVDAPYKMCCLSDQLHLPVYDLHLHSVEEWKNAGCNIYTLPLLTIEVFGKYVTEALKQFRDTGLQPLDMFMSQNYINQILRMTDADQFIQ